MTIGTFNNINIGTSFVNGDDDGEDIVARNQPDNQGKNAISEVGVSITEENAAAAKAYVDAIAAGIAIKFVAKAASTMPLRLNADVENGDGLDSVVLFTGELILLKDQADPKENGLFYVNDFDAPVRLVSTDLVDSCVVYVEQGIVNEEKFYQITGTFTGPGGTPNYGIDTIIVTEIIVDPMSHPAPPGGADNDYTRRVLLSYSSPVSTIVGLCEADRAVTEIIIKVTQTFNGVNPTITIGDDTHGVAYLMSDALSDLKTLGNYDGEDTIYYTANTNVKVYLNVDGSTQGAVEVLVSFL